MEGKRALLRCWSCFVFKFDCWFAGIVPPGAGRRREHGCSCLHSAWQHTDGTRAAGPARAAGAAAVVSCSLVGTDRLACLVPFRFDIARGAWSICTLRACSRVGSLKARAGGQAEVRPVLAWLSRSVHRDVDVQYGKWELTLCGQPPVHTKPAPT
eukprot:214562-Chlamydomonas_euryale.AAC.9